jgi:Cu-processing system ATP-binding protein
MTAMLTVSGLSVRIGAATILKRVSLDVAEGERVALLGHNGAGKSTLFKTILGFLPLAEGTLRVAGERPGSAAARNAVSYLPENVAFHGALTGAEILRHFARLRGEAPARADALLETVGVAHAASRPVGTWSKGMRQRLGLAQALLGAPRLLLLDEPTSGLDPVSRREFFALVDEAASRGAAVLLSSHGLEEVQNRTDRIAILSRGRLVADGPLAALAERAALRAQIRVTADQGGAADALSHRIGGTRCNGAAVEITCPVAEKFALVRRLATDAAVRDIDVRLPTLDDVYKHFSDLGGPGT